MKTQLTRILEYFPNQSYSYSNLSDNPNLTWEYLSKNLNHPWRWFSEISENYFLTWEIINECLKYDIDLNFRCISSNPNINWEIIKDNPDKEWDWYHVSKNPNITIETVINNLDKPWDWNGLESNPNITINHINKYKDIINKRFNYPKWDIYGIKNSHKIKLDSLNVKWDVVLNNPIFPWCWYDLSSNLNININIIKDSLKSKKINTNWKWHNISCNPNITWDDIVNNPNLPWEWEYVSVNPNITMDIIKSTLKKCSKKYNYKNKDWEYWEYEMYYQGNRKDKYDYYYEIISINGLKPKWYWREVSANPNLTFEFIRDNPNLNWDWCNISANEFNHAPYFQSDNYRKRQTKIMHDIIKDELLSSKNFNKFI